MYLEIFIYKTKSCIFKKLSKNMTVTYKERICFYLYVSRKEIFEFCLNKDNQSKIRGNFL